MALSNYLAEIWGILIVILSLALLLKDSYVKRLFASMEDEGKVFMWAVVTLVIGVSMALAHNVWVKNWQVVITLFGWASLIKGLALLFCPEVMKKWVKKVENSQLIPFALLVGVFIGLVLVYLGFMA